ncbi:MAG: DNA-binding domain-containing protein, partial [Acidobacteriaceae bacterium]
MSQAMNHALSQPISQPWSQLLEIQRRMAAAVMHPLTRTEAMPRRRRDGASNIAEAEAIIRPNDRLTSFERLEIYNRQYWFRVLGSLAEDFPALNAVLGAKRFDALILAYLNENPSTSFSLRNLGNRLPTWLENQSKFTGARHQLAVDVARLEWAHVEAFDRASLPPLSADHFKDLRPASVLTLQPHLQLLALSYPVDDLVLDAHKGGQEADAASNAATESGIAKAGGAGRARASKMARTPIWLAVHRFNNSVYYRRIEREEFLLLSAIRDGKSIEEAITIALGGESEQIRDQAVKIEQYFS